MLCSRAQQCILALQIFVTVTEVLLQITTPPCILPSLYTLLHVVLGSSLRTVPLWAYHRCQTRQQQQQQLGQQPHSSVSALIAVGERCQSRLVLHCLQLMWLLLVQTQYLPSSMQAHSRSAPLPTADGVAATAPPSPAVATATAPAAAMHASCWHTPSAAVTGSNAAANEAQSAPCLQHISRLFRSTAAASTAAPVPATP
eukprot:GHRR01019134.1.p1 GENE.GHRR01019134.1~~GHRR01019134.1.p1  ORF type:complete len:200 (+),score=75.97 GHRR01019134.1:1043-1642(+)